MTNEQIREHLLWAGVNNLKEFGYPEVTTETILTDEVYKEFFKSMLNDSLGNAKQIDEVINQLLSEFEKPKVCEHQYEYYGFPIASKRCKVCGYEKM